MANLFLCSHPTESAFRSGFFSNPLILIGFAAELVLVIFIDYTPAGNALFDTAPIPLSVWLFAIVLALTTLIAEELRKLIVRRSAKAVQVTHGP